MLFGLLGMECGFAEGLERALLGLLWGSVLGLVMVHMTGLLLLARWIMGEA